MKWPTTRITTPPWPPPRVKHLAGLPLQPRRLNSRQKPAGARQRGSGSLHSAGKFHRILPGGRHRVSAGYARPRGLTRCYAIGDARLNLNRVILNTMLFAFVPMLMLREGAGRGALFARASRVFAAILITLSAAIALFAGPLISILGPGLAAPEHQQAVTLLRLFAPSTVCAGASGIFAALLYTERRFIVPGLYQTCINVGTIAGALLLGKVAGINGFAIGYTVGTVLQLFLTWRASREVRRNLRAGPALIARISKTDILLKPGMFLLYASLISANIVVTRRFATEAGPGMAAAFDYCMRCVSVFIAYMVYPVASSLVPEIARLKGLHQEQHAYRLIDRSVGLMAIAAAVSLAIGVAIRQPLIAILFERGNFTAQSSAAGSNSRRFHRFRAESAGVGSARPDRALLLRYGPPPPAVDRRVHSGDGKRGTDVGTARAGQTDEPFDSWTRRVGRPGGGFCYFVYVDPPAAQGGKPRAVAGGSRINNLSLPPAADALKAAATGAHPFARRCTRSAPHWSAQTYLLQVPEYFGTAEGRPQFCQKRLHFGKNSDGLALGLSEQRRIDGALVHHSGRHLPIGRHHPYISTVGTHHRRGCIRPPKSD